MPEPYSGLLSQVQTWGLHIIELFVLGYIVFHTRKIILQYRKEKGSSPDFYTALCTACESAFPGRLANLLAFEVSVIYYSLFAWKKRELKDNEYTYTKKTGIISIVVVLIFLILVETFALHILVQRWSTTAAFILSGISVYTCFQLIALIKSFSRRPIYLDVEEKKLYLCYGFFNHTTIDLSDITGMTPSKRSLPEDGSIVKFSALDLLDSHNLIIHLSTENTLQRIYGLEKNYKSIAIWIDEREKFIYQLQSMGIINMEENL